MTGSIAIRVEEGLGGPAAPTATPADNEEQALVARCLAGDCENYRPLVQRYQRLIFSVALRMLGSRADAEDVAQQAFVDAFRALDRFRGDDRPRAFGTWILRIAINRCKDILKSKQRTEESLSADIACSEAMFAHQPKSPEASVADLQQRHALAQALAKVPPKYREILILRDVENLSYEEIRVVLGLPITTLKIRVVRARAMMRAHLANPSDEGPA